MGGDHHQLQHQLAARVARRMHELTPKYETDIIGGVFVAYWDGQEPRQCVPEGALIPVSRAVWCKQQGTLDYLWSASPGTGPTLEMGCFDAFEDSSAVLEDCERLQQITNETDVQFVVDYYLLLAQRLSELFGYPIVADSYDGIVHPGIAVQLQKLLPPATYARWRELGWVPISPAD